MPPRTITFEGRALTPREVLCFEVVRGVLLEQLTLVEGAIALSIPAGDLERVVAGARDRVIRTLGEAALEEARQGFPLAS